MDKRKKEFPNTPAWRFFISIRTQGTNDGQENEKVSKSGTECSEWGGLDSPFSWFSFLLFHLLQVEPPGRQ